MYLLMRVKSLMSLKVWSNLGLPKKKSKSPFVGLFLENHTKSNFPNFAPEIGLFGHFFSDLRICFFFVWVYFSRDFLKAKQTEYSKARSSWVHASEASPASERVTQIEQTKQIKHGACERSELRERASQAQSSHSGAV